MYHTISNSKKAQQATSMIHLMMRNTPCEISCRETKINVMQSSYYRLSQCSLVSTPFCAWHRKSPTAEIHGSHMWAMNDMYHIISEHISRDHQICLLHLFMWMQKSTFTLYEEDIHIMYMRHELQISHRGIDRSQQSSHSMSWLFSRLHHKHLSLAQHPW